MKKKEVPVFYFLFLIALLVASCAPDAATKSDTADVSRQTAVLFENDTTNKNEKDGEILLPSALPSNNDVEDVHVAQEIVKTDITPPPASPSNLKEDVKEKLILIEPRLTYPDAYNGPLYDTSSQVGDSAPMDLYFDGIDRNGVNFFIGFFAIEGRPSKSLLASYAGAGYLIDSLKKHPRRIVPFVSLGLPSDQAKDLVGEKLTGRFKNVIEGLKEIVGASTVKGFGEIEHYAWDVDITDPKMLQLFDLADTHDLFVMFHPPVGQERPLKALMEKYPHITFLIHMFPEDFDDERDAIINLLKTYDNVYFSIDADHMLYDGTTGLLYKYQDDALEQAKSNFVSDFDSHYESLLDDALERYKPLVDAVPEKVMWGTELGTRYGYEPEVYDRVIKYSRMFIGKMGLEIRENLGYTNALRVFGQGVTLQNDFFVLDTTGWKECSGSQIDECDNECDFSEDDPESGACVDRCTAQNQCIDGEDD